MKTRAILLSALLFFVTPFLFPSVAEPVEPNPERLREAQVIALDLDGQSLRVPATMPGKQGVGYSTREVILRWPSVLSYKTGEEMAAGCSTVGAA